MGPCLTAPLKNDTITTTIERKYIMNQKLFTESFQEIMQEKPIEEDKSKDLSLAKLFDLPNLSQGSRIKLGNRFELTINRYLKNFKKVTSFKDDSSSLWMNTKTNEVISDGAGKGMKDIDILFTKDMTTYYLESKTNLNLDTEKSHATIEKVKTITNCLKNNVDYPNVTGKVFSPFWDETNVPISARIKKSGMIMWFSELNDILELGLTKSSWVDMCKEFGKQIKE
mgnify:CR=1 FL=1